MSRTIDAIDGGGPPGGAGPPDSGGPPGGGGPPGPGGGSLDVVSHGPEETRRLAALLGPLLRPGDVLLLEGPLGAGKTVFAQGLAAGLGVAEPVTSPTFILIHEHRGRLPLYHVDLYRLSGEAEAEAIGLDEYLGGDGVAAVEWPDRAPGLVPDGRLVVTLAPADGEGERRLRLTAAGERHRRLLAALAARWREGETPAREPEGG